MLAALFLSALPLGAGAQMAIGDPGPGEVRGIQDLNNSGQIGTARFVPEAKGTRVIVKIRGVRPGRIQPLAILRGKNCEALEPTVGWTLPPIINGESNAVVMAPASKILSGNYVIVAHADDNVPGHNLACGQLFR